MYGNLISNRQLARLLETKEIVIEPFVAASMKGTAYTLRPGRVLRRRADGKWVGAHSFHDEKDVPYLMEPNEYVVVEIKERVRIASGGIVGRFITASNNIETGLLIVSGQIDSKYGTDGEGLRVGVKNLLSEKNQILSTTRLTHVEFFDLRGTSIDPIHLSGEDQLLRAIRKFRGFDDGPVPPDEDE